ncbi:MAG: DUF3418 domain-containing protein, partial [Deltaproteobacteria bacterium]|nr:DUF3418 domain-containing protein [Deltaproteobacteria bacterium]
KWLYQQVVRELFERNIRSKSDFDSHAGVVKTEILSTGQDLLNRIVPVMEAYHEARSTISAVELENRLKPAIIKYLGGIRKDLVKLVPDNFAALYDGDRLRHLKRYVKAISMRAQRGVVHLEKDMSRDKELQPYVEKLKGMLKALSPKVSDEKRNAIEAFHWMIEEYKVSLFAQELKTAVPVSKKRIDKMVGEIERMV